MEFCRIDNALIITQCPEQCNVPRGMSENVRSLDCIVNEPWRTLVFALGGSLSSIVRILTHLNCPGLNSLIWKGQIGPIRTFAMKI